MAEWFKAAVLKTADRKVREFESLSLRQFLTLSRVQWGGISASEFDGLGTDAIFGFAISLFRSSRKLKSPQLNAPDNQTEGDCSRNRCGNPQTFI